VAERQPDPLSTQSLLAVFGGVQGLLDSSVPATVFVVARFFTSLNGAIVAAVAAGLLVVALRAVRGESLQQAFSGFFGLVLAVVIARSTGSGKGFFLPGILITAGSGVAFGVSLLAGRPVVALGLAAVDPRYKVWREHAPLRRACVLATGIWTVSFFVRAAVATTVLLLVGDRSSDNLVVLVVINAVKWPMILGSALATIALVKRADVPEVAATDA
jgi:hypothetical protein